MIDAVVGGSEGGSKGPDSSEDECRLELVAVADGVGREEAVEKAEEGRDDVHGAHWNDGSDVLVEELEVS